MRITIEPDTCLGHGQCELAAPELFQVDDDGFVQVLVAEPEGAQVDAAERAARACPTRAIVLA